MKRFMMLMCLVGVVSLSFGCAGVRESNEGFAAHAEAFRFFTLAIPHDDFEAAWKQVPDGASVTTVASSASDFTSVVGVLNQIFGFTSTHIGGTKP